MANTESSTPVKKTEPTYRYTADRLIGNGSFGVVYQAVCDETQEVVAIKKVLQDKRFKVLFHISLYFYFLRIVNCKLRVC